MLEFFLGIGFGGTLVLMVIYLTPREGSSMSTIPQGLQDALNTALAAKDAADAALAAQQIAAANVASVQAALTAANTNLANETAALNTARQQLEAVEDSYLQPGAVLPTPPVTPPAS